MELTAKANILHTDKIDIIANNLTLVITVENAKKLATELLTEIETQELREKETLAYFEKSNFTGD